MSFGDDIKARKAEKSLGEIVGEVSEKASLLVREEIELAKAEVTQKVSKLGKGAVVAILAGAIFFFAVMILLIGLAFFFNDLLDYGAVWPGFGIVFVLLLVLTAVAGYLAYRWLSTGAPTPDLAIQEAKATREAIEHQTVERDQLSRSLEHGEAVEEAAKS